MSALPPSLPPPGPLPLPAAAPAAGGGAKLAAQFSALPANALIEATVRPAPQGGGLVLLQTPAGALLVKLPVTPPPGTTLQLQVTSPAPGLQLRLLSINGQPAPPAMQVTIAIPPSIAAGIASPARQPGLPGPAAEGEATPDSAAAGGEPADQAQSTGAASQPPPLKAGQSEGAPTGLAATLIRAAPSPSAAGGSPFPEGTTFTVRITSAQPAPSSPGNTLPSAAPADADSAAPTPPQPAAAEGPQIPAAQRSALTAPTTSPPAAPAAADSTARPFLEAAESATPQSPPPPSPAPAPPANQPSPPVAAAPQPAAASSPAPNAVPPLFSSEAPPPPGGASGTAPSPPDVSTPPAPLPANDAPALPPTLDGTVAPNSHAGQPLIQTSFGLLALQAGVNLAPGTQVELAVVGRPAIPEGSPERLHAEEPPGPLSPAGWPNLDEAVGVLRQSDPEAALQLARHLPQPGPQLAMSLFLLVSAAQSSGLREWLGEKTAKALERAGHNDLLDRLDQDLGGMKSTVQMPAGGNWLSLYLPLLLGERIERIRLTMRRPPRDEREAAQRDQEGARFLLDLEMSRLGPLQLDGLVKRASRRFDLIIRTRTALPEDIRHDIAGIFCRSLEGFGMTGTASFQKTANFIEPAPLERAANGGLVI